MMMCFSVWHLHIEYNHFLFFLKFTAAIVSFGEVSTEQRQDVEKHGLSIYTWDEFLLMVINKYRLVN